MRNSNNNRSVTIGTIIIVLGTVFLFKNLGFFQFDIFRYVFNWYSWVIFAGIITLSKNNGQENVGYGLIAFGGLFLLMDLDIIPGFKISTFWPLILIAIGISYILKERRRDSPQGLIPDGSPDFINDTNIFSGGEFFISSENFKGGRITNIFGGGEYNFNRSKLAPSSENVLDLFILFGGIEMIVPPDWQVVSEVTAVFGGFSNKKSRYENSTTIVDREKVLYLKGIVLFGGGEVKSY